MRSAALCLLLLMPAPARSLVKNPDTYTYLTISDADSLDPAWAYDTASHMILLNIYEPLFFYDKDSTDKLIPLVAERVPTRGNGLISADGKTYTIPIRKGILFHDGTPLTPEDVRYSIMRFMLQDRAGGPSSLLLDPLLGFPSTRDASGRLNADAYRAAERAVGVSDGSLVLRLRAPSAPLLSILASWAPIVSKAWAIKNGDWDGTEASWTRFNNPSKNSSPFFTRANGTGPFQLERWDRKNKEFVLGRHEKYWRGPAKLKRVIVKGVNEFGTRKLMLQAGDADAIYADPMVYSELVGIPGVDIIDNLPLIDMNPIAFFTFQIKTAGNPYVGSGKFDGRGVPPDFFTDKDLRLAFAHSFDYEGYIRDVYRGRATRATGCVPKTLAAFHPAGRAAYAFDLARAERHLRRAWGGRVWETGFRFTLTYNAGNGARQTLCQILKRNIESLNPKFQIDVRPVEWPAFLDAYQAGKLPIFIMGWHADYPDPHSFAFPLMHSKGDYPTIQGYGNPAADRLIDAAKSEHDAAKRRAIYARLVEIEAEDVPHLLISESVRYRAQRSWVRGFYHNPVFPDSPWGGYFYTLWKQQ